MEQNPATAGDLFDPRRFQEQSGSTELMRDLIAIFEEECQALLGNIEGALQNNDLEQLKQATHAFKGMIGNYCSRTILDQAANLDASAMDKNTESVRRLLPQVHESVSHLQSRLMAFGKDLSC